MLRLTFMTTLSLSAALPSLCLGQDYDTEDIIVTATKIETTANDLGLSVAVVTGEPLAQLDGAEEFSQYVAGLQAAVANGNQIAFQIRGIGAVDHQALTPTAAAVYVDGVYQATNVQTGPLLFDIERAEVLKGPQGSLYGRNATAGAINFISVTPSQDSEGYIAGEYGRFNRVNLKAAANIPVSDIFSMRLSGRYLKQDPVIDNVVTDNDVTAPNSAGGKRDEFGIRGIGHLQASENTDVLLNIHYAEDNGINPSPRNEGLDVGKHEISVGPDGIQDTDNEFFGASVKVTHDRGDFKLTSISAFEGYDQQYGFDFAALPQFFGGQTANLSYDRDFTQVSQELRLNYNRDDMNLMAGLYLEAEDFDQDYRVFCGALNTDTLVGSCNYIAAARRVGAAPTPNGAAASTLQSLITQERKTAALFTYNTFDLSGQLELVAGARLTGERINGRGQGNHIFTNGEVGINNTLSGGDIVGPAIGSNTLSETNVSGNLGLNYRFNDAILGYATLSNGFKSGGFNGEVIDNAAHFDDEGLFEAETVNTAELGLKFKTAALTFNVASFYNDYNNPQARFFRQVTLENGQSIGLNSLSNFKAATSYGLDADVTYRPIEGLKLMAATTILDSEIKDSALPSLNGDALPFASDFSATAGFEYSWQLSGNLGATLQANGKYQSDFTTGADTATAEAFVQDGYAVIDARAAVDFPNGVELGLWGRNLGNADYAVSAYRFFGATTFRGNPRSYGISAKYSY